MFFLGVLAVCASAQLPKIDDTKTQDSDPPPRTITENLAKARIERDKKDYRQMLENGEETVKISDQLVKSYTKNNQLTEADRKQIDRLEKLVKKIRSELGATNDDSDDKNPSANENPEIKDQNYIQRLQTMSADLVDKLKNTSRFSISVAAVQSSNALLGLVRFLKIKRN